MSLEKKQIELAWKMVDYGKDRDLYEFKDCYNSDEEAFDNFLPLLKSKKSLNNLLHEISEDIENTEVLLENNKTDKELNIFINKAYKLHRELYEYKKELKKMKRL